MLPSDLPDLRKYPVVEKFVLERLTPNLVDVRGLMKKPEYNYIATAGLCGIVSGISVTLFRPAITRKMSAPCRFCKQTKKIYIGTGDLFRSVLLTYFPWEGATDAAEKANAIYKFFRNPLAHALGEDSKPGRGIRILKSKETSTGSGKRRGLSERELNRVERATNRPQSLKPPISGGGTNWDLAVEPFYWGVLQLIRNLAADTGQMSNAEARFCTGKIVWHN